MRVLHVITGLTVGGAETALVRLLPALRSRGVEGEVVSLTGDSPLGPYIRDQGFPVEALHGQRASPSPRLIGSVSAILHARRPDLVQTWMYHADLVGGLAGRRNKLPVVWGIHHTISRRSDLKPATYAIARLNAAISHFVPGRIICCARSSQATHARLGYDRDKMQVIPNGVDTDVFRPDPAARSDVRGELGLSNDSLLIGLCARFDPQKDHQTFLRAAALLKSQFPGLHFVLWGKDVDAGNELLRSWVIAEGLADEVHLLGLRADSAHLHASLDISTLASSYGEAFPLVVAEAMACGVPCTVTNVGDSADIVGDTGRVVPPRQPESLAAAWAALLAIPQGDRARLGANARQRILERFSLDRMAGAYAQVYRDIIGGADHPGQN
jgi:glycosyltransferase involved in cell wall biosynthesis